MSNPASKEQKVANVPNLRFTKSNFDLRSLSDVASYRNRASFVSKSKFISNENLLPDFGGVVPYSSEESVKGISFKKGDVLIGNIRPYLKKTYSPSFDGCCSADVLVLEPNGIKPSYLYYLISNDSFFDYVMEACKGSKMPRGDKSWILAKEIAVPSLIEQEKVSSFLGLIDARIAAQNKIIEAKKSLMNQINDSLYARADKTFICFGKVADLFSGLTGKSSIDFGSGHPYVSFLDVLNNKTIDYSPGSLVEVKASEKQNVLQRGDVLFTLSSETPEEVGVASVFLRNEPVYLNSFCVSMRIRDRAAIDPEYAAWLFSTRAFRKHIYPFAQGSTRYNLNTCSFMTSTFAVPIVEQQSIFSRVLNTLEAEIELEENIRSKMIVQKQFFLRNLFI